MADEPSFWQFSTALIVVGLIVTVGVVGLTEATGVGDDIRENSQNFERFCTNVYGDDALVYSEGAALSPEHSGLHCDAGPGTDTIHLNQIPPDIWQQYKSGDVSERYVMERLEPTPGMFSMFTSKAIAPALLIVALLSAAIYVVGRYRGEESEDE